jgi:type II secretory pathway component PulF
MKKYLSHQQIAYISRQLAFALSSGLPLKAALTFLAGECKEKKAALFLQELGEKISRGQSPGSSLREMSFHLPPIFVEFVLLGEQQGNNFSNFSIFLKILCIVLVLPK